MTNQLLRRRSALTKGTTHIALISLTFAFMAWLPSKVLTKTTTVTPGNGTLNTALSNADAGDVLQLEAGVYIGNETGNFPGVGTTGFTLSKSITIQGV